MVCSPDGFIKDFSLSTSPIGEAKNPLKRNYVDLRLAGYVAWGSFDVEEADSHCFVAVRPHPPGLTQPGRAGQSGNGGGQQPGGQAGAGGATGEEGETARQRKKKPPPTTDPAGTGEKKTGQRSKKLHNGAFPKLTAADVVVSFRGTTSMKNLKTDCSCAFTRFRNLDQRQMRVFRGMVRKMEEEESKRMNSLSSLMSEMRRDISGIIEEDEDPHLHDTEVDDSYLEEGGLHAGIWESYLTLRIDYLEKVLEATTAFVLAGFTTVRICCTGHSLGGALATYASYDIARLIQRIQARSLDPAKWQCVQVHMYNYGAPRVVWAHDTREYNRVTPHGFRLVFDRDVITATPPSIRGFQHIGSEVFLDGAGNMLLDPAFLEKWMLQSRRSLKDHLLTSYKQGLVKVLEHARKKLEAKRPGNSKNSNSNNNDNGGSSSSNNNNNNNNNKLSTPLSAQTGIK
eukprot:g77246.t1